MTDPLFSEQNQPVLQPLGLDFKRILDRAIRFWYVIVAFLIAALAYAFYKNRYTERIYPITASVIIRETQEISGAEFLYKNALIDQYRNYLNEPYIIRSYPLMEKVIQNGNFHVSFYREGYFMTTEAYDYVPVKVLSCDAGNIRSGRFLFQLTDSSHYTLRVFSEKKEHEGEAQIFSLGDSVQFMGISFCIARIPERRIHPYIGVPFLLVIRHPREVASSYISRLKVSWAEQGAGVINLSVTGANIAKEIDFMNELIATYQGRDLEKKNETAMRTIQFIQQQLGNIQDSMSRVELKLERFGGSTRSKDLSNQAQRLLEKIEELESQRSELVFRQNYYNYLETYLRKNEGSYDQIILPGSLGLTDQVLGDLVKQLIALQSDIKLYAMPERMDNPLLQSKIKRLNEVRRDLEGALQSLRESDRIRKSFLDQQIKLLDSQLATLPASERQFIGVQRNYSLLENLYIYLMQRLSEASISKAANTSDIVMVNPPMAGGPIQPKTMQNYLFAVLLGLLIPFGIFVIVEILNNKVQSKEDIEKITSIPFIGGIGHSKHFSNLIVKDRPRSGIAESFRALRTNLSYFTQNSNNQVLMVTSSISGEGKTFTSINLATVFALSGKKTLLVGADMRRPKIFQDFQNSNDRGLSTFLSGMHGFGEIVQDTDIHNLYLVSGGPVPPNPSELLLTARFSEFIQQATQAFDFIIIDTPPLAMVTDAFIISGYAHHTVFVVRQNFTPKQLVRSMDDYHRAGRIKNISILLNDIYRSGLGYGYGQGYAYYQGYSYGYRKNVHGYYEED